MQTAPLLIAVIAGFELLTLSLVTALYYYEAIRGIYQHNRALEIKAERMFAIGSGLVVLTVVALALTLWSDATWLLLISKLVVSFVLVVIAGCSLCWLLGYWVNERWYFIPWKSAGTPPEKCDPPSTG